MSHKISNSRVKGESIRQLTAYHPRITRGENAAKKAHRRGDECIMRAVDAGDILHIRRMNRNTNNATTIPVFSTQKS